MSCSWYTISDAAKLIGKNRNTIYRWIDEGKIGGDDIRELPSGVMVVCVNSLLKARVRPRKRVRK